MPTTHRPLRNSSSKSVQTPKKTNKRGSKRRASGEALNPRTPKQARREALDSSRFSPLPRPRQLQIASTRNSLALFVWGCGDDGSLGLRPYHVDNEEFSRPQRHYPSRIKSVAAGGMYTLFLDRDGKIWSCGNNDSGALGRETECARYRWGPPGISYEDLVSEPYMVRALRFYNVSRICAGNELSAAVTDAGELFIWGAVRNSKGPIVLPNGQRFIQTPTPLCSPVSFATCGENHILLVSTSGELYAWGINEGHQLGTASNGAAVMGLPVRVNLPFPHPVVHIAAGGMHSFAIDSRGDVWGWGTNLRGQIGIHTGEKGYEEVIKNPQRVSTMCKGNPILAGSHVVDIVCGEFHSMFLLDDGRVFTCGAYDSGQLGLGPGPTLASVNKAYHPGVLKGIALPLEVWFPFPSRKRERIIGIEADSRRSMAWTRSHLFVWGMGNVGELGLGPNISEMFQPTLVDLDGWRPVQVSCGGQHSLALFTEN